MFKQCTLTVEEIEEKFKIRLESFNSYEDTEDNVRFKWEDLLNMANMLEYLQYKDAEKFNQEPIQCKRTGYLCPCGAVLTSPNGKYQHFKTKRHKSYVIRRENYFASCDKTTEAYAIE